MSQAPHVLVVDPDPATREWIEVHLRRDGHAVAGVGDGAAALREIDTRTPAAGVLALALQDVAGLELLRTLRATHPGLPVIVVSAAESIDAAVDCMRLGASDFLQKPIDRERLVRSVRNARDRERLAPHVVLPADATDERGFGTIV
ncbi:MAG: response regulator, partial [Planctomycetes bacterium]|nr:response regulator [Planctomycetota bacterium]